MLWPFLQQVYICRDSTSQRVDLKIQNVDYNWHITHTQYVPSQVIYTNAQYPELKWKECAPANLAIVPIVKNDFHTKTEACEGFERL